MAARARIVVAGWGAFPMAKERALDVASVLRFHGNGMHCLGTTKDGHPRHPLYVRGDTRPVAFAIREGGRA
jgi:hypothetical protein